MGRYDGEDFADVERCRPDEHEFAFNGLCHRCRWTREELVNDARRVIERFGADFGVVFREAT